MSTVVITVGGVDITDVVEFRTAKFVSTVNGIAGSAEFRVKDATGTLSFLAGTLVTLDIDGVRSWGGYIMQARRVYPLSVTDLSLDSTFYWNIVCSDYNILLTKRLVYDHDHPEKLYVTAPDAYKCSTTRPADWQPGIADNIIIDEILANYTDLGADGVDLTDVQNVGVPEPDLCHSYTTTNTVAQFLGGLDFQFLGSIWYIGPDFAFHYVDDETVTAPHPLSDVPATDTVNYRDIEIFLDGSNLANDAYVWGTGLGANHWVFARSTDDDSITEHHLWQWADITTTLIHQTSAQLRADTYVDGSPSHHRGHKDDGVQVTATIFEPGYTAGMVVDFTSEIYGYSASLPIRRCTITFPTQASPRWELNLGFNPDAAWEGFEFRPPPVIGSVLPPIVRIVVPKPVACYDFNLGASPLVLEAFEGDAIIGEKEDFTWGIPIGGNFHATMRITFSENASSSGISDYDDNMGFHWSIGAVRLDLLPSSFVDGFDTPGLSILLLRDPSSYDVGGHFAYAYLPSHFWNDLVAAGHYALIVLENNGGVVQVKAYDENDLDPGWLAGLDWLPSTTSGTAGDGVDIDDQTGSGLSNGDPHEAMDATIAGVNICAAGGAPGIIIDTYSRTNSGSWEATEGSDPITYEEHKGTAVVATNGSQATITDSNQNIQGGMALHVPGATSIDAQIEVVDIGNHNYIELIFDGVTAGNYHVGARYRVTSKSGSSLGGTTRVKTNLGNSSSDSHSVTQPFYIRATADASGVQMKIWHVGDAEPGWMVTQPMAGGPMPPLGYVTVGWESDSVATSITLDNLNALASVAAPSFTQGSGSDVCAPPISGNGVGPYKTAQSYLTRTLKAYDNGKLINPVDVTEEDPTAGTFHLAAAPAGKLVVCYAILDQYTGGSGGSGGSTGGGGSQGGGGSGTGTGGGGTGGSGGSSGTGDLGPVYGSIATDTKANLQCGPQGKIAFKFKASTNSPINSIRFEQRGGPKGYSSQNGNGGTMRVSIQGDASGKPDGVELAGEDYSPSNPPGGWTTYDEITFSSPYTPGSGDVLYVVFENEDPNFVGYISVNMIFVYNDVLVPRQPTFKDADYAVLNGTGGSNWQVMGRYTAPLDVTYDDGTHDGQAYIGNIIEDYGTISGSSQMVRETITVSGGSKTVTGGGVRVRRTSGTGDLVVTLEQGDGTLIEAVNIPYTKIPQSSPGGDNGGSAWVLFDFLTSHVLTDGDTFHLVLSCAGGTVYTSACILQGDSVGMLSFAFRDGGGELTADGGSSWDPLYAFDDVDIQFYFTVIP